MESELTALKIGSKDINHELVEAATIGDLEKVHLCLQNGANVNFISRLEDRLNIEDLVYKSAALMKAAKNGHLPVAIKLLQHQKNHGERKTYWTVLVETMKNQTFDSETSLNSLLNCTSQEELKDLKEFSLVSKHFPLLVYLVEAGVDVNNLFRNGMTPLMVAASMGLSATITYLLEHGANPDFELYGNDKLISSALLCAVKENQREAILLLLNHGVNMDTISSSIAFYFAVSRGDLDTIKRLVLHGARPTMTLSYDLYKMNLIELDDFSLLSEKVSPLYMALYSNQPHVACHFLSVGFITDFDVTSLRHQKDLRCRLEADESCLRALEILDHVTCRPLPLVILSFVKVLERLPKNRQLLIRNVDRLKIPNGMKTRLLFNPKIILDLL